MASMLAEAIRGLRNYREIMKSMDMAPDVKAFYEERAKAEEENIRFYRSNESAIVLEVEGLFDCPVTYRNAASLADELEDWTEENYEGVSFTVTFKKMTGREFGRLPLVDL